MKRYLETIAEAVISDVNGVCSFAALIVAALSAIAMAHQASASFMSIMSVVGTFALVLLFPTLISIAIGTIQYMGEKNDPKRLLEEARVRLETEKILIEVEQLAQERRRLIDDHLQEQIHDACKIATMLDQPREACRRPVALYQ